MCAQRVNLSVPVVLSAFALSGMLSAANIHHALEKGTTPKVLVATATLRSPIDGSVAATVVMACPSPRARSNVEVLYSLAATAEVAPEVFRLYEQDRPHSVVHLIFSSGQELAKKGYTVASAGMPAYTHCAPAGAAFWLVDMKTHQVSMRGTLSPYAWRQAPFQPVGNARH